MYDIPDNSPGPCVSIWYDWENFGYLDINNPQAGLKSYTIFLDLGNTNRLKLSERIFLS